MLTTLCHFTKQSTAVILAILPLSILLAQHEQPSRKPMQIIEITSEAQVIPVLIGKRDNPLLQFTISVEGDLDTQHLTEIQVHSQGAAVTDLQLISQGKTIGDYEDSRFSVNHSLVAGDNLFEIIGAVSPNTELGTHLRFSLTDIKIDGKSLNRRFESSHRVGIAVRQRGQDDCHTYRIPGIATTKQGTLIAVYDNRYRSGRDLPGDIDVGMSRSTNGGQTWEPRRVIMDMGDDPKWNYDGIGDPSILVDQTTGTIWVAATWSHGNRSWHGSGPGMSPEETGQVMLTRSDDDGLTWSQPTNITAQVKDPKWRFVLPSPGNGITLQDGTLAFPAQFRSEDEPPNSGKPFSTILYSQDRGTSWKIGSGVKISTTESQVVQLDDGSIMINCRDDRGGSRSIYTTKDLGKTWQIHPTSRKALQEPICNADLLKITHRDHGTLLVFSNPNTTSGRHHYTLKVSRDEGLTWPEQYHTLYDARSGSGYSSLTKVDADHIGVLYEGLGDLYFLRFSIEALLK